jgi:DNA-binding transcriptional MerR regulator
MKRGGGRRYYRPDDVALLRGIRHLLYGEGYTIRGVQRILNDQGIGFVQAVWQEGAAQPPHGTNDEEEMAEDAGSGADLLHEESGLRGRIVSLIGRDLGDRQDDAAERPDPPLKSAPVPRVEPSDRALHGVERVAPPAAEPAPAPPPAPPAPGLASEDLRKLQAALHELGECRKLIAAAVARAE